MIKVRNLEGKDFKEIEKLMRELCKEVDFPFDSNQWRVSISKRILNHMGPQGMFVAEDIESGKIVGISLAEIRTGVIGENQGFIGDFIVDSEYRGRKIGEELLKETIKFFKSLGIDKIQVNLRSNLLPAIKLFKKYGFKEAWIVLEKEIL